MLAKIAIVVALVLVERLFALREQRVLREGWRTDVAHVLFSQLLVQAGLVVAIGLVLAGLAGVAEALAPLQALVARQPWWAQLGEAVLVTDLCAYGVHRAAHEVPALWRFHRVHHSSEQLDWLAAARIHPVDLVIVRTTQFAPLFLLGFSRETFGAYAALLSVWALVLHANLPLRFGPLRFAFASPQFHHWHHARGVRANFAGQLPLLDWAFGTLHLPRVGFPPAYGLDVPRATSDGTAADADEPLPTRWLGQIARPFGRLR